nr:MAG TPA_asm: hypothetical protein [Caudoviricetes sp.]
MLPDRHLNKTNLSVSFADSSPTQGSHWQDGFGPAE